MTVRWETVEVNGSPMRVYLGVPDHDPRPRPGVLVAMHRPGVDAQIQDTVHRLFRAGYVAAAPDLYHWQSPDADPMKRSGFLKDNEMIADLKATIGLFRKLGQPVDPIGIVGFCLGGRVSYLAAATIDEVKAAAAFYGGNIMVVRGEPPTPFERSKDIHCPIIAFTGTQDANPSPEDMRKIDAELTRLNKVHEFHLYNDTDHAFMNFSAGRYRERTAKAAWGECMAFFEQHLKRGVK